MRKKGINQCTINYDGKSYAVCPNGDEDKDGSGGLWDLSKKYTENLSLHFDSSFQMNPFFERTMQRVQREIYYFLQYELLYSLRSQLNPQKDSGSEM